MMGEAGHAAVSIVTMIIGVAIISVVLSNTAQTANVIGAISTGLGSLISAATKPISGGGILSGLGG
jgi:uncharacterized protein YebE (UPF0316 family)